MVDVKFFSAGGPASGVELSGLGDGVYDHIGMFGDGSGTMIVPGQAQDMTWIVDASGAPRPGGEIGRAMSNVKWVDASGASIASGARVALPITESGFATIRIQVSGLPVFNIQNARLYAYEGSGNFISNGPSGMWVLSCEIIPPHLPGTGDTEWALIDATNYNYMVDRTVEVGYAASGEWHYYVGLSARPKLTASSGLQTFGLYFTCETV